MTTTFRTGVRAALANPALQEALDKNAERRRAGWETAFASLPESEARKRQAAEVRRRTIAELDVHLDAFTAQLQGQGVVVHRAKDGPTAAARPTTVRISSATTGQRARSRLRTARRSVR